MVECSDGRSERKVENYTNSQKSRASSNYGVVMLTQDHHSTREKSALRGLPAAEGYVEASNEPIKGKLLVGN